MTVFICTIAIENFNVQINTITAESQAEESGLAGIRIMRRVHFFKHCR